MSVHKAKKTSKRDKPRDLQSRPKYKREGHEGEGEGDGEEEGFEGLKEEVKHITSSKRRNL